MLHRQKTQNYASLCVCAQVQLQQDRFEIPQTDLFRLSNNGSARLKKTAVTAAVCPTHPALARPHPCQFSAVPQAPCRAVGSLGLQTATDAIKTITPGALWEKFTLVGKFSVGRMWVLVAS